MPYVLRKGIQEDLSVNWETGSFSIYSGVSVGMLSDTYLLNDKSYSGKEAVWSP